MRQRTRRSIFFSTLLARVQFRKLSKLNFSFHIVIIEVKVRNPSSFQNKLDTLSFHLDILRSQQLKEATLPGGFNLTN